MSCSYEGFSVRRSTMISVPARSDRPQRITGSANQHVRIEIIATSFVNVRIVSDDEIPTEKQSFFETNWKKASDLYENGHLILRLTQTLISTFFLTKSTVFFKKKYQILTLKSTFQNFVEQKTLKKISVSTKDQPLFEAIFYNKKLFEKVVVRRGGMFGNTKISSKVHLSTGSFKI